jgi:hypothetical protein
MRGKAVSKGRRISGQDTVDEIAAVVGDTAAADLSRHFGGINLYVPITMGEHHPIAAAMGYDAALKLAEWAGGGTICIPKQVERRARVILLRSQALTVAQIARETGYSERQVFRLLREHKNDQQPGLFE